MPTSPSITRLSGPFRGPLSHRCAIWKRQASTRRTRINEILKQIFKEMMGYSSLSVFLNDFMLHLDEKQYSEEQKQVMLEMFGVYVTKIMFDEPDNEYRTDVN